MKGLVFKEFLALIEKEFGYETVDKMIEDSNLKSKGAYTSVGTYPFQELILMVEKLSQYSKISVSILVKAFGEHLSEVFRIAFPDLYKNKCAFGFLSSINDYIHVEALKLYPDAELPTFEIEKSDKMRLTIHYKSKRPFADLAEGLIHGSLQYFAEPIEMKVEDTSKGKGTSRRFVLTKKEKGNQ